MIKGLPLSEAREQNPRFRPGYATLRGGLFCFRKKVEKNLKKMGKRVDETTIPWYNIHRKREPIPAERSAKVEILQNTRKRNQL